MQVVRDLNNDPAIHGILVQSPPPKHIDEEEIIRTIDPRKDVDGFHPQNVAKLALEDPTGFVPCTPAGSMRLLAAAGIDTNGAEAVVLGRSMIVGKPMALLLMAKNANATVTVAHSRSKDLPAICRRADILIAAVGRPDMVKADWVKDGAVVIDVGINRTEAGLVGDVDFGGAASVASAMPVDKRAAQASSAARGATRRIRRRGSGGRQSAPRSTAAATGPPAGNPPPGDDDHAGSAGWQ